MRHHRAEFLSEAAHVEHGGALAFEVRRHRQDLADGDHAHSADSRDEDPEGVIESVLPRLRQERKFRFPFRRGGLALLQIAAFDRDEARAESLQAGVVLVAGGLVDGALATELGLERLDRKAIRLDAAIAAAFTDHLVDDHAPGRVGEFAALPAPAFLGGAGLHVDDRRHAFFLAQLALHCVELLARTDRCSGGPVESCRQRFFLVHDRDDRAHALGGDLARHHRRVERPVEGLAAGHRHRVVVEDLVGHADPGCDCGADREQSRVVVGAVTDVGEHVRAFGERRLPDPGRAFGAHVGERRSVAVHPDRHEVAADSGHGSAPLRNLGRGVVRAAGAEVGQAVRHDAGFRECLLLEVEIGDPLAVALA